MSVSVYVISAVPAETPDTIPVVLPTDATPLLLLLQVPVPLLPNVIVLPIHNCVGPDMADGNGFTVAVVMYVLVQAAPVPLFTVTE